MASIERTAYPRFKQNLTPTELEQLYQPSLEEINFVRHHARGDRQQLTLLVLLKTHQHLGYAPTKTSVPKQVQHYLSDCLGLTDKRIMLAETPNRRFFTVDNHSTETVFIVTVRQYGLSWLSVPGLMGAKRLLVVPSKLLLTR